MRLLESGEVVAAMDVDPDGWIGDDDWRSATMVGRWLWPVGGVPVPVWPCGMGVCGWVRGE